MRTRILVNDDDADIRTVLRDLLESEGYQVTEASTAHEALVQTEARYFDAVLLAIGLPDADGWSILSYLQATILTLPVIMLTASMFKDQWANSSARGAFSYLSKLFDRDQLRFVIRQAVGWS